MPARTRRIRWNSGNGSPVMYAWDSRMSSVRASARLASPTSRRMARSACWTASRAAVTTCSLSVLAVSAASAASATGAGWAAATFAASWVMTSRSAGGSHAWSVSSTRLGTVVA
jgi:hypothetical protein